MANGVESWPVASSEEDKLADYHDDNEGSGALNELSGYMYLDPEWKRYMLDDLHQTLDDTFIRSSQTAPPEDIQQLRQRLDNANNHFRRKAAEVIVDEEAVSLLARLCQESSLEIRNLEICHHGLALSRLSAANFCEISSNVIYITSSGHSFIESIDQG